MNIIKRMKRSESSLFAALAAGTLLMVSCESNDPSATGSVALKMEASSTSGTTINGRVQTSAVINDFKISIGEIEFEFDEEDDHFDSDSAFNEGSQLKGPFVIDVLEPNGFIEQVITTVAVPNATYEEIKFKLYKNTNAGEMNGKSILVKGTIDGKPFVFWHDADEQFEIDFENADRDLIINGNSAAIVINLQLERIFSTVNGGVNLGLAKDGDGDGVIEINPGSADNDGNKELAETIKTLLEGATELMDDND